MKRAFNLLIVFVAIVIVVGISLVIILSVDSKNVGFKDFLKADGQRIYAGKNEIQLKGVNIGGWLIQEQWMNSTKMKDQKTLINTLETRFGKEQAESLLNSYKKAYITEEDLDIIKYLGMNSVRLPFSYMDIFDESFNVKGNAFQLLDWFVKEAGKRGLYTILDLHGAPGSQNGEDHSGDTSGSLLFSEKSYQDKTVKLWEVVATHYKDNKNIAAFDILNEPSGGSDGRTNLVQWMVFDRIYKAIRAIDTNHIIMIESVWDTENLPAPKSAIFNWENVVYQYHHYCWEGVTDSLKTKTFIDRKVNDIKESNFNVPTYIGEFTGFALEENWDTMLSAYEKNGYSWCVWTYKVEGNDSSWGLYTSDIGRVDIETASYEEILAHWSKVGTKVSFAKNEKIISFLKKYL